jgi:hypothetical protein
MAEYIVSVEFPFSMDTYLDNEERLEKLVGCSCGGAGTDGLTRDMSWYFKTAPKAVAAFQKLCKLKWLDSCRLERD